MSNIHFDDLSEEVKTLIKFRKARKLTQHELASLCLVSLKTLSDWENGHRKPSPIHLKVIEFVENSPSPFQVLVEKEIRTARSLHRPLNSCHEGYAVILEELEEFWEETRKKREVRNIVILLSELVQISAMAQRAAEDLGLIKQAE